MGTCGLMVRASVSRLRGRGFEPQLGQHVMSLGKAIILHLYPAVNGYKKVVQIIAHTALGDPCKN